MTHPIPAEIISAAQAAQRAWRVPAAVTIAQWALESAWGAHMPAGSNNPFGIKAKAGEPFVQAMTSEYIKGKLTRVAQNFRKYDNIAQAFDAHGKLLATVGAYAKARQYTHDDLKYADALTGSYATDPNYGNLLRALIQGNKLTQYDIAS